MTERTHAVEGTGFLAPGVATAVREQHLQMVFEAVTAILPLPESAMEVARASGLLQGCHRYLLTVEDYQRWARLAHDILTLMTNVYIQLYTTEERSRADEHP
jgi:hypothetical protein